MAIYHFTLSNIKRTQKSAVAASAYLNRSKMDDERTGLSFNYSKKSGLLYSEIIGFNKSNSELWNRAELAEKKSISLTAREAIIALPAELSLEENKSLVRDFCESLRAKYGVACEFVLHKPDAEGDYRNVHTHILFTTRTVDNLGNFGAKVRELDNKQTGSIEFANMRKDWERLGNAYLAKNGFIPSLDCRSLQDKGEKREPRKHLGNFETQLQRKQIMTHAQQTNRLNDEVQDLRAMLDEITKIQNQNIKILTECYELIEAMPDAPAKKAGLSFKR